MVEKSVTGEEGVNLLLVVCQMVFEFGKLFNEDETNEGLLAFIEKRKPKFWKIVI